jgi:hypothetical protein
VTTWLVGVVIKNGWGIQRLVDGGSMKANENLLRGQVWELVKSKSKKNKPCVVFEERFLCCAYLIGSLNLLYQLLGACIENASDFILDGLGEM